MGSVSLALVLTPHGHLLLAQEADAPSLDAALAGRLRDAFERGSGHGLLRLGADEAGTALPPVYSYWREFGARYVTALCTQPDIEAQREKARVPRPPDEELDWIGPGRASHGWRGVSDGRGPRRFVAGTRRGLRDGAVRIQMRRAGVSQAPEPGVEPGGPRAFQCC